MTKAKDKDLFDIDKFDLDEEWVHQPLLYRKYARMLAKASKAVEKSKGALAEARAETSKRIRKNPVKYGYKKATEEIVKTGHVLLPTYKKTLDAYIKAKYRFDLLMGIVKMLDHRKSALERLVNLHGQNYFSRPTPAMEDREQVETAMQSMARKRKRKKKRGKGSRK
jgi:Glu-tRNA(Gln) amidotransferase subunit E-like FAD-binding protein